MEMVLLSTFIHYCGGVCTCTGATAGHRSLLPYFRQYRNPGQALALISNNSSSISKIIAHYKALGCLGTTGMIFVKKLFICLSYKQLPTTVTRLVNLRLGLEVNKPGVYICNKYIRKYILNKIHVEYYL